MSIADKLLTVVENEQKIHDEVVGQSDLIAQIKAKVNSLPEAGGGGEKPTLFAPTIALNSVSSELTITDNRNGDFVPWYDLYIGGEKITTLTSKTAMLADYIEHTETTNVYVQSNLTNFNPSESNVVEWVKVAETDGTVGLAYTNYGSYAVCTGMGEATATNIEIASLYEGVPVTSISTEAFYNKSSLRGVVIPDSVTSIYSDAFRACNYLTSVVLGSSIQSIGESAFAFTAIKSLEIPNSLTFIGKMVFNNCSKLYRVDFSKHTAIPTLSSYVFNNTPANLQIKVPASLIDQWKAATNWADYADKIVTEFTNTL